VRRLLALTPLALLVGPTLLWSGTGCGRRAATASAASSASAASRTSAGSSTPGAASTVPRVDHGALDTATPDGSPGLAATMIATTIYQAPDTAAPRLGYIRLGRAVRRDRTPVSGKGCKQEWYRVYPIGFVCTDEATIDLEDPVVRAAARGPDLSQPLPYRYGFVRATAPQYLRIPTKKEQIDAEFKLEEHLKTFTTERAEWQRVQLGANDLPLDARGLASPTAKPAPGFRPSTEWSELELYGGADGRIPWWLEGGRKIPNVSGYAAPAYALFADRVRRKTGLSFVDAFRTRSEDLEREFAVTVDLRLVPVSKVKPDSGSAFHGIEVGPSFPFPFAFVTLENARTHQLIKGKDATRPVGAVPRRSIVPLTGQARIKAGERFYQTAKDPTVWLRAADLGVVTRPPSLPPEAERGEKWIDICIAQQTLVLYEGTRPWYATLISSGRDRNGDPKTTLSTPTGSFRLRSKHIAAAMDSNENSTVAGGTRASAPSLSGDAKATAERLLAAEKSGKKLDEDDQRRLANVKKGRHPEYGITVRRGAANFELRDVPWIQYFAAGYAMHGAYWHDVFGVPRSHGCVNLAPIDARVVFLWTDPPVPPGWHGINVGQEMGQGTLVVVRE